MIQYLTRKGERSGKMLANIWIVGNEVKTSGNCINSKVIVYSLVTTIPNGPYIKFVLLFPRQQRLKVSWYLNNTCCYLCRLQVGFSLFLERLPFYLLWWINQSELLTAFVSVRPYLGLSDQGFLSTFRPFVSGMNVEINVIYIPLCVAFKLDGQLTRHFAPHS